MGNHRSTILRSLVRGAPAERANNLNFVFSGEPKEMTQLLCKVANGQWTVSNIPVVPTPKADVVTFHVHNPMHR